MGALHEDTSGIFTKNVLIKPHADNKTPFIRTLKKTVARIALTHCADAGKICAHPAGIAGKL